MNASSVYSRFPDYANAIDIPGDAYTAPSDGWIRANVNRFSSQASAGEVTYIYTSINGEIVSQIGLSITSSNAYFALDSGLLPVKAGDEITFNAQSTSSYAKRFYPAKS